MVGLTKGALAVAPERVLSTPICENGFTGAAFGAALAGMHPIVEFMYPDFTLEAADQLFNHIPRARYMYGGTHEVPIVVRTQIARGRGYGPQHSCDPAALFALFPGWRIAAPATAGRLRRSLQRGDAHPRPGPRHRRPPAHEDDRAAAPRRVRSRGSAGRGPRRATR